MRPSGICWSCWNPPAGPGTPFHGALLLPDSLRVIVIALAAVSAALIVVSIVRIDNFPQRMRFWCSLLFTALLASIEVEHLGDTANWRLGVVLLTLIWQTLSVGAYLRDNRREGRHVRRRVLERRR